MDVVKLGKALRNLLERLDSRLAERISPRQLRSYWSYLDAGERTELLDALCATLVKRQVPVTGEERDILAGILAMYDNPDARHTYVKDPEGVLAKLNVTSAS
ncbi:MULTISPECIES: hypothetical protein [Actinoalloteichus]|uniref:Uncharacterized protein n=1 Tax=Actinoalloteichus fjordicus TaxID=1612552 RepID=A0AAC9LDK8_9PSEU|nr:MULTISPECIES: hypothetical protein [Actinoalloteichus]APU15386.1 hypothetical protein UA74_16780 [Actinoalloteichus fjordicus]APU21453.1 hypothetical protein UA75_17315 [Actinoalloteichus sp. GBA129-24]